MNSFDLTGKTASEVAALGRKGYPLVLDVRNEESIAEATAKAWEQAGQTILIGEISRGAVRAVPQK